MILLLVLNIYHFKHLLNKLLINVYLKIIIFKIFHFFELNHLKMLHNHQILIINSDLILNFNKFIFIILNVNLIHFNLINIINVFILLFIYIFLLIFYSFLIIIIKYLKSFLINLYLINF